LANVSIIIPVYNCEHWLPLTLNTCLEQKDFIKEIIIIDDFSTDNSWEVILDYQKIHYDIIKGFRNQNKGGNNARNYGFSLSSGNYIQWLDADDQLVGPKLEKQLNCFEESVDIVYSDWIQDTYNNMKLVRREYKKNKQVDDFIYHLLIDKWSTPHCYLMSRRIAEKLADIIAWNPETTVLQDREYFTMAALLGAKFKYTPGYFAIYNKWSTNTVSALPRKEQRYLNMQKIFDRFENSIISRHEIAQRNKRQYLTALDTQRLIAYVDGYSMNLKRKLNFWVIDWNLVPGIRTALKLVRKMYLINKEKI